MQNHSEDHLLEKSIIENSASSIDINLVVQNAGQCLITGNYDLAVKQYQYLIKMIPESWINHYGLAYGLNKIGDVKSARIPAAIAAEKAPDNYTVQLLYAELCIANSDWVSCEQVGRVLSQLDNNNISTHKTLGLIAEHRGDIISAESHFKIVVQRNPANVANVVAMGNFYLRHGKIAKAAGFFANALELEPKNHQLLDRMGHCFLKLKHFENARDCYLYALEMYPEGIPYLCNIGAAYHALGEFEQALEMYRTALVIQPDSADVHYNMSLTLLSLARFDHGWTEYEWRFKSSSYSHNYHNIGGLPSWDKKPRNSSRILVCQEQGLGDAIQFIRYVPYLQTLGLSITVLSNESLRRLFSTIEGVSRIITSEADITDCDCMIWMLSLPFALRYYEIPDEVQYIKVDEAVIKSKKLFIRSNDKVKVGIVWGGNPDHHNDEYRSFHIRSARILFDLQDIEFYSLQKGLHGDELQSLDFPIIDLSPHISDFLDTAAIMKNLDLVISVDTTPLHLAGAIGVPVWGLIPCNADWRWMHNRADTPWYSSMKLYRNTVDGSWEDVFERICVDLMAFAKKK